MNSFRILFMDFVWMRMVTVVMNFDLKCMNFFKKFKNIRCHHYQRFFKKINSPWLPKWFKIWKTAIKAFLKLTMIKWHLDCKKEKLELIAKSLLGWGNWRRLIDSCNKSSSALQKIRGFPLILQHGGSS